MTVEPKQSPFRTPLTARRVGAGVSGSLQEIRYALEELRGRILDRTVPHDWVARRVYQIEAAVVDTRDTASAKEGEAVRVQSDLKVAHMLAGYDVGREVHGTVIHVCDPEEEVRVVPDPTTGELHRSGLPALCGVVLDFVVGDLSRLRPGPLCAGCSVAFTSFVFNPANRTTWADDEDLYAEVAPDQGCGRLDCCAGAETGA